MFLTTALLAEGHHGGSGVTWLLWVALAFFALMVVIGWLVSRKQPPAEEAHPVEHAHAVHEHAEHAEHAEDDLTILEGIGPKVAQILREAGIRTFADLAQAEAAHVQEILNAAGLRMMNPAGWIEQARLAAAGDMEGLKKLQEELKGGRRS